jgi:hypothetical protein
MAFGVERIEPGQGEDRPLGPGGSSHSAVLLNDVTHDLGLVMVIRFAFREEHYATVDELDRGIQTLIDLGWRIVQATGRDNGPFTVLFRNG